VNEGALRAALANGAAGLSATAGDDAEALAAIRPLVPAVVLVPIVLHTAPGILLTVRTDSLSTHAGQVSFPGGRIERGDADPIAAALRETEEEIGLPPNLVEVIGVLPEHLTGTGYRITPVLGLVQPPPALRPDPREVAHVFELPLSVLLDEAAPRRERREFRGRMREYWVVPHPEQYIWGATAAILVNLGRMLRHAG
jgi:8-oxo-dGTP pyrophosphatase MutT (NUDIX family)